MQLWGRSWSKAELMQRAGALTQLGGITRFEYCDGKAKGVTALRVKTAAGLEFTVLPEKGLSIFEAAYQGRSLCWHSSTGVVHPAYYDSQNIQWLKTFDGGLLTTCGLAAAGQPCEDQGEQLGLHGAISNIAAEHVSWREEWKDDELLLTIEGRVRESHLFGPNLTMRRVIQTSLAGRFLRLSDCIENEGGEDAPLMVIYHCNFGFPLLTDRSRIYAPSRQADPRTDFAALHKESWQVFEAPSAGIGERVYYHDMAAGADGRVRVVLVSDDAVRDFGVELSYQTATLPRLIEWKLTGSGSFVLGLEPANCKAEGRKAEREAGTLRILRPGEEEKFEIELRVLDGEPEVAEAIAGLAL